MSDNIVRCGLDQSVRPSSNDVSKAVSCINYLAVLRKLGMIIFLHLCPEGD